MVPLFFPAKFELISGFNYNVTDNLLLCNAIQCTVQWDWQKVEPISGLNHYPVNH